MKTYYIKQVLDFFHKGWITAYIEDGGFIQLPFSIEVKLIKKLKDYEKVLVKEGSHKGDTVLLSYLLKSNNSNYSCLDQDLKIKKNVVIRVKSNRLFFDKQVVNIIYDTNHLLPGEYKIGFPVLIKKENNKYLLETHGGSRFAQTWFPVYQAETTFIEKYIHFGSISKGCITVRYAYKQIPSSEWNSLYMYLIMSRTNGGLASLIIE